MILETIFGFVTIRIITNMYLYEEKKLSAVPNFIICLIFGRKSLANISFFISSESGVDSLLFYLDTIANVKQFRLYKFAFNFGFHWMFQVSWIRKRDLHILTAGTAVYTSDQRFQVTKTTPFISNWIEIFECNTINVYGLNIYVGMIFRKFRFRSNDFDCRQSYLLTMETKWNLLKLSTILWMLWDSVSMFQFSILFVIVFIISHGVLKFFFLLFGSFIS